MTLLSHSLNGSAHSDFVKHDMPFPEPSYEILKSWPQYQATCPENVPSNIAGFYDQGLENLAARRWDAAGAMFRKTLDVATKQLRPDLKKKVLYDRIESMVKDGDLTGAMGKWSHRIRLDGNDAIHDEEPETEADARANKRFTEAFLTYSYTLPALVEEGQEASGTNGHIVGE